MALFGWIVRILVVLFLLRLVMRFFGGVVRGYSSPGPSRKPNQPATREGGHLVRDPHCGTYVPASRALRVGSGDNAMFFCSEACRSAWAERKAG